MRNLKAAQFKWFCTVLCSFLLLAASSQPCAIVTDSIVCLGNTSVFVLKTNAVVQSYSWNLDESSSSTQSAPSVKYKLLGKKTITVLATLAGGGTCTASKIITVYDIPVARFVIGKDSQTCVNKSLICLIDSSKSGKSGSSLTNRTMIWGDGARDSSLGSFNRKCHHYNEDDRFFILLEVSDVKGCHSKFIDTIIIRPDVKAKIYQELNFSSCDSSVYCFFDSSYVDTLGLLTRLWKVDGQTGKNATICHTYTKTIKDTVQLILKNEAGCRDTARLAVNVITKKVPFKLISDNSWVCFRNGKFAYKKQSHPDMVSYDWKVSDSQDNPLSPLRVDQGQDSDLIYITKLGKFLVTLNVDYNGCTQVYGPDTVEVLGPIADFIVRNGVQCEPSDKEVFLCNNPINYKSNNVTFFWDFHDKRSPVCTTDTKENLYTTSNCRYSVDEFPHHLYTHDSCYRPGLLLVDTITGCRDSIYKTVAIGHPDLTGTSALPGFMAAKGKQQCFGPIDFTFQEALPCSFSHMWFKSDTANKKAKFVRDDTLIINGNYQKGTVLSYNYDAVFQKNGNVTAAFIYEVGYDEYYTDCKSKTKSKKVCYDTAYYTFNILAQDAKFKISPKLQGCRPFEINVQPLDSFQDSLTVSIWDWGDGTKTVDTLDSNIGYIPSHKHIYINNGIYSVGHTLYNTRGCVQSAGLVVYVGHYTNFTSRKLFCLGESVKFTEGCDYYDFLSARTYKWSIPNSKETLKWDFGDGSAGTTKPSPTYTYTQPGSYTVTLISKDSMGCLDTAVRKDYIIVVKLKAGFTTARKEFLCGEFAQFFDTSSTGLSDSITQNHAVDSVVFRKWDFGDATAPSFLKNPFHNYTSFGWKEVTLIVVNKMKCADTLKKMVYIKGPVPSFEIVEDSIGCSPFTVRLRNTSVDSTCKTFLWLMGDGNIISTDKDTDITYTYKNPGIYEIYLIGADSVKNIYSGNTYYCNAIYPDTLLPKTYKKRVLVDETKPSDFSIPDTLCVHEEFNVFDQSDTIYSIFNIKFGNGDSATSGRPVKFTYQYDSGGIYKIEYTPTYTATPPHKACIDTTVKTIVVEDVVANFDIDTPLVAEEAIFGFRNKSVNAVRYEWDFGDPSSGSDNKSKEINPVHGYKDSGAYDVCLWAYSSNGCVDTACKRVLNKFQHNIIVPNVYTNDADGNNDAFDIFIRGEEKYELYIYNLWGELVFMGMEDGEGNDGKNWNGHVFNGSEVCPTGTYYYLFKYRFRHYDETETRKGTVTLLRKNE
jgi:PKD repeat protein